MCDFSIAWFRCLFAAFLPFDVLIQVWDRLLSAGIHFAVFVAAAMLHGLRVKLLALDSKGALLGQLFFCKDGCSITPLLEIAVSYWSRESLARCREDCERVPPLWQYRRQIESMITSAVRLPPPQITSASLCCRPSTPSPRVTVVASRDGRVRSLRFAYTHNGLEPSFPSPHMHTDRRLFTLADDHAEAFAPHAGVGWGGGAGGSTTAFFHARLDPPPQEGWRAPVAAVEACFDGTSPGFLITSLVPPTRSEVHARTHTHPHSHPHPLLPSLARSHSPSLPRSLARSLPPSLACSLPTSLPPSLPRSLASPPRLIPSSPPCPLLSRTLAHTPYECVGPPCARAGGGSPRALCADEKGMKGGEGGRGGAGIENGRMQRTVSCACVACVCVCVFVFGVYFGSLPVHSLRFLPRGLELVPYPPRLCTLTVLGDSRRRLSSNLPSPPTLHLNPLTTS